MKILVIVLGKMLAWMPEGIAEGMAWLAGTTVYYAFSKRKRMMLRNLHHAFPKKPESWRRMIARKSCRRMAEMALFILVSPHLSTKRIRKMFTTDKSFTDFAEERLQSKRPDILLFPHFSLIESLTLYPAFYDLPEGSPEQEIGVIYRPLNNKDLENWVKKTRGRYGAKLLSRKQGFTEAMGILERNGVVGILFDQNAGTPGSMSMLFDRVASTTDLPDLLAKKFGAEVSVFYTKRTGFWRAKAKVARLPKPTEETPAVVTANAWLEDTLRSSDTHCADWLWYHNRWRTQDHFTKRFRLEAKRNALDKAQKFYGYHEMPRKTQFWFRLPNWLGDVVMTVPLLQALRESRPDAEFTFLAQKAYHGFVERMGLAEHVIGLPTKGLGYFRQFSQYRTEYPDTYYLFTNSFRGDLESRIIGAPQRFGIIRDGKPRPFLTQGWQLPKGMNEAEIHQTHLWEQAFQYFGLNRELDYSPLTNVFEAPKSPTPVIGMICGTENSPEKRWPIEHWRELITKMIHKNPGAKIELYGTPRDTDITSAIAQGFDSEQVKNLAGKTGLIEFAEHLKGCKTVICNDTGGMHMANMIGTPIVALFGPTNPVRTGPIFNSNHTIIQPEGCPKTGGGDIAKIHASQVLEYII